MHKLQIGDKVKVINNQSGHGHDFDSIFTIKEMQDRNHTMHIWVKESGAYFYESDLEKIPKPNKKPGKFIITDPEYIMNLKQWDQIVDNNPNYKQDLENQTFPLKSTFHNTKIPIIFHKIEATPYGKGEAWFNNDEQIQSGSGMLCIAENQNEWLDQDYRIKFETLSAAQENFQAILNKL